MNEELLLNQIQENIRDAEGHLAHLETKSFSMKKIKQTHYWKGYRDAMVRMDYLIYLEKDKKEVSING